MYPPPDSVPPQEVSHGQQPSGGGPRLKVSSCAACASVGAHDSAAPNMSRGNTRDLKNNRVQSSQHLTIVRIHVDSQDPGQ